MSNPKSLMAALLTVLAACDGGGGSTSNGSSSSSGTSGSGTSGGISAVMSPTDAARLLEQATFGPTPSEVTRIAALGFNGYIQQQIATAATGYPGFTYVPHTAPPTCQYDATAPTAPASICARDNYSLFQVQRKFFENTLTGPDQLRQRVAFALSQIFVVSGTEIYEAYGMAAYQNMLLNDAFGNFRQLLQDVTLSPVMGHYLNVAQNAKANPALGTSPNENYAREVLQLFSIGVYLLNADGSLMLDANGQPQPTYDQNVIEGFSSIFTGWTYAPLPGSAAAWSDPINYQGTMAPFPNYHDTGSKLLLNGVNVAAGGTPETDLAVGLDTIFNHPNVGPFISKQLIQHLVTSNPSPSYVARISAVFADNGQGVRGDLAAVVKAILGDVEARGDAPSDPNAGHLREPALYIATLLRALGGQSDGVFPRNQISGMGQPLFTPPTVFNFYPPGYQLPASTTFAPEFFIQDAATALARANFANQLIFNGGATPDPTVTASTGTTIALIPLLGTPPLSPDGLVNELNTLLMHGSLSSTAHGAIATAVNAAPITDPLGQVKAAAYLIGTSAQFQVEH